MNRCFYFCPVCGINDDTAYLRCMRPDCPDGRDAGYRAEAKEAAIVDADHRWRMLNDQLDAANKKLKRYETRFGPLNDEA